MRETSSRTQVTRRTAVPSVCHQTNRVGTNNHLLRHAQIVFILHVDSLVGVRPWATSIAPAMKEEG